jgi:hypothetical protein
MIDDDEAHEALAMLEGMKQGLECHVQAVKEGMPTFDERMDQHVAAIQHDIKLSRRLGDMKLPFDQEMLLFTVLTLPPEALDVLRAHLGIRARLKKAGAKQA